MESSTGVHMLTKAFQPAEPCSPPPTIIGIYGVSGSGKTFLLNHLRAKMDPKRFAFFDGSQVIGSTTPGGLEAFQLMDNDDKTHWRNLAIEGIAAECVRLRRAAVIAGHYMFWNHHEEPNVVWTRADQRHYTHIMYLDTPAETIVQHCRGDTSQTREVLTSSSIRRWQSAEKQCLNRMCRDQSILFFSTPNNRPITEIATILLDWHTKSDAQNARYARNALDKIIAKRPVPDTVVFMDADKTLAPFDAGAMFWTRVAGIRPAEGRAETLKSIYSSRLGYSYTAFRQTMLLYEEIAGEVDFEATCSAVADEIILYEEMSELLHNLRDKSGLTVVVLTCGLRRVWELVLERAELSSNVSVIGGGRMSDGYVVTPSTKADLVSYLRSRLVSVWAIGDSPVDLPMMMAADRAIVVVGEEEIRSRSMDSALSEALERHGLRASQVLLPRHCSPRLDVTRLPLINLSDEQTMNDLRGFRRPFVAHDTEEASALVLMTATRDACNSGPALRKAHRTIGYYMAMRYLPNMIGVEEFSIQHVQGHSSIGHRLADERGTTIVALMRGGEPLAMGINEAFPLMRFVHARTPDDVVTEHLQGQSCVLIVDSVINSGNTVVKFIHRIGTLSSGIRIVVIAGVIQDQAIRPDSAIGRLRISPALRIISLRLSENQFVGTGVTDTGNRLFNTTHMQ